MSITIISDGSCHQSRRCGAWAAIVINNTPGRDTFSYRVEGEERTNSSYRMEIAPIVAALRSLDLRYRGPIRIITDHASLAESINRHVPNRMANHCTDLLNELHNFTMRYRITAEHQLSHTGNPAHEWCDKLSKTRSGIMAGYAR